MRPKVTLSVYIPCAHCGGAGPEGGVCEQCGEPVPVQRRKQ